VEELEVVAHSVERVLTSMPKAAPAQDISRRLAGAVSGHHGMYYLVADGTGRTLFATPGPKMEALAKTQSAASGVDADKLHVWQEQDQSYRGTVAPWCVRMPIKAPHCPTPSSWRRPPAFMTIFS
jgi:two-component system heavy metal sensor histidine kinase CusS